MRQLKLSPLAFCELRPAPGDDPAAAVLGRDEPRQRPWLRRSQGPGDERPCLFLLPLAGDFARCGLLDHRPHACRVYPTALRGQTIELRGERVCPALSFPEGPTAADLDWAARWRELLDWRQVDGLVAGAWNGQVEALPRVEEPMAENYLAFVLRIQARTQVWLTERGEPPVVAAARSLAELAAAAEPEIDLEAPLD